MPLNEMGSSGSPEPRKVLPDELTEGFLKLGLEEGNRVVMHASLSSIGIVDGGAGMVLHRLLNVLGKKGILLMPTFTSVTRHSSTHANFTRAGCWCEGRETRHLPFILELQPDKEIGEIAHRLCSWPGSRRSRHPAYSFVAVGNDSDRFVRKYSLTDPLQPLKTLLEQDSFVLTVGVELDSISAIHIAEQRAVPRKYVKERALTMASTGPIWVEVVALGCSVGFQRLATHITQREIQQASIGSAIAKLYSVKKLLATTKRVLDENPNALACGRSECISCQAARD